MPNGRLALALRELESADWLLFERFVSEFLAVEFPSLRTTAAPSGDGGRDGELVRLDGAPRTAFQYSLRKDWSAKISQTKTRLAETMPQVNHIIYCTNQSIGPAGDELIAAFRADGVALEIRDQSWFVDRENSYPQRQVAAEDLASRIVDPLLHREGISRSLGADLSDDEARIALLHLGLEGYDAASNRNLTRSSFEALVLATLHDSDAQNTRTLEQIAAEVSHFVPVGDRAQIDAQISGAVKRLSAKNGPVKYLRRSDSYHLAYEHQDQARQRTAEFIARQRKVEDELGAALLKVTDEIETADLEALCRRLREGIEEVLLTRGERFASAVDGGNIRANLRVRDVLELLTQKGLSTSPLTEETAAAVIFEVLDNPSPETREHLGKLADAYTLFAFLRQTPDVQKVVVDIFSGGEIWLDTSVVLPLLAETLDESAAGKYTTLLQAAVDAGFKLHVTDGIIEEVSAHLTRSLACARTQPADWENAVPFLFRSFMEAGESRARFHSWIEEFRSDRRPLDDVREYLSDVHRIERRNLAEVADAAPVELRGAVQEIWMASHERKRQQRDRAHITPEISTRLIAHDVENAVGVMQLREGSGKSGVGYMQWWLTLDRTAFGMASKLRDSLGDHAPESPALSTDFLAQLLRLGPLRQALARETRVELPIVSGMGRYDVLPAELLERADEIRKQFEGQSERLVKRNVRDGVNDLKWKREIELVEDDEIVG